MEPWDSRVHNSPALANAQAIRDKIGAIDLNVLSVEDREKFRRADLVAETIIEKLNKADPRLVSVTALSTIGSNLANVSSYLDTWAAGNPEYVTHVESEIDAAVIQLAVLTPDMDTPEAKEAITRIRKSVAANINRADQLIDLLKKRGSEADVAVDEKLASARQGFDQLEQDLDKLEADIESARNANAKIITDQTAAYNQAESERSAKFAEQIAVHQKQLTENLTNIENEAKSSLDEIKKKAQGDQQTIYEAKKEVERLLGIIGDEALVGDYSKRAKSEAQTAEIWAIVTIVSIAMAIIAGAVFANDVSKSVSDAVTISWQYIVAKVVLISSFGALAAYAARQSSEHRTAQRDSEQMALQLSALPLYARNIDDRESRDKLLVDLALNLFGKREQKHDTKTDENENPLLITQLAEALLELIKKTKP